MLDGFCGIIKGYFIIAKCAGNVLEADLFAFVEYTKNHFGLPGIDLFFKESASPVNII